MNAENLPRQLRIAIATLGRFHVLDLARELSALGHEVRFYSYVPKRRAVRFGLPSRCHVSLLVLLWPLVALSRLLRRGPLSTPIERLLQRAANAAVRFRLQPCDVFICMSGIYVEAAEYAKRRYGANVVLERGSMHIAAQRDILARVQELHSGAMTVSDWTVDRELRGYRLADVIVIPSAHAEASFLERGFASTQLARIPYGVELDVFSPDASVTRDPNMVLFVGSWSYQKGVDVLGAAMASLSSSGARLQHVGSVGDAPMPTEPWFSTAGHVDQLKLREWYRRAAVLVLPSRQEGLSLVLFQALACGCQIVGSRLSGATDLAALEGLANMVSVVDCEDPEQLRAAVKQRLQSPVHEGLGSGVRQQLSWVSYGRRYANMLAALDRSQA